MTDLASRVAAEVPRAIDDVVRLVAIPSVSSMPEHHADVQRSADAVADRHHQPVLSGQAKPPQG